MDKHDKVIAASSEEHLKNRIKDLEKRLAFAEETTKKQSEMINRLQRWASEIEANARDMEAEKDAKIAILQAKIIKLVNDYV